MPSAVKQDDKGKYLDAKGDPTFSVKPDGTTDWYTYSGFRRYHSECHVCHGPDAEGSTYAPALKDSVKRLNYARILWDCCWWQAESRWRRKQGHAGARR